MVILRQIFSINQNSLYSVRKEPFYLNKYELDKLRDSHLIHCGLGKPTAPVTGGA